MSRDPDALTLNHKMYQYLTNSRAFLTLLTNQHLPDILEYSDLLNKNLNNTKMPTVNIYVSPEMQDTFKLNFDSANMLRRFFAKILSCPERKLKADEISIRSIEISPVMNAGLLTPLEVDVTAHNYPSRVKNQDKICEKINLYFRKLCKLGPKSAATWLRLCELGHSMK